MEAYISGANFHYTVLSHECGDMQVVQSVSRDAWIFDGEFADHFGVLLRFHQDSKRFRCAQTLNELPSLRKCQGVRERRIGELPPS